MAEGGLHLATGFGAQPFLSTYRRTELLERFLALGTVKGLGLLACIFLSHILTWIGRPFGALLWDVRAARMLEGGTFGRLAEKRLLRRFRRNWIRRTPGEASLLATYLTQGESILLRQRFRAFGPGYAERMKLPRLPEDPLRLGDLVVLKRAIPETGEKGVLYLQYTPAIRTFISLFDHVKIGKEYRLVLEPSTWGYQDLEFLLLQGTGIDVVVQAQDHRDYTFMERLGGNLHPLRLGAGDWVDPRLFVPSSEKRYDFVFVASWDPLKRHDLLFRSLRVAGLLHAKLALIGYPSGGGTMARILRLAESEGLTQVVAREMIPRTEVAAMVAASRCGLMLSRREGANRGIYECLLSDVPVLLSSANRGVNREVVNEWTGRIVDDGDLPSALLDMHANSARYRPRAWAERHTGCFNARCHLSKFLRKRSAATGEPWTVDIAPIYSSPSARYLDAEDVVRFAPEYDRLASFLREPQHADARR